MTSNPNFKAIFVLMEVRDHPFRITFIEFNYSIFHDAFGPVVGIALRPVLSRARMEGFTPTRGLGLSVYAILKK